MLIEYARGNSVELGFDRRLHAYKVGDNAVPSATKVLGVISKPALIPWALKSGATWLENNLFYDDTSSSKGQGIFHTKGLGLDALIKGMKSAYRTKSGDAINIGTITHDWLEAAIKWKLGEGEPPTMPRNEGAQKSIEAFRSWLEDNEVEWHSAEEKVYHRKYRYAGTVDAVATVNGEFCVVDWKTSKAIYPEYHLQVAAYAKAIETMYGKSVDATYILRCDKHTGGFEVGRSTEVDENFKAFLGALTLYKRLKELR